MEIGSDFFCKLCLEAFCLKQVIQIKSLLWFLSGTCFSVLWWNLTYIIAYHSRLCKSGTVMEFPYCIQLFFMVCCFLPHNRYSYNYWLPLFCPTQVKLSKCSTSSEIRMSRRSWSCNAIVIVADVTKVKAKFMSTGTLSAMLESWLIWVALVPSIVRGKKREQYAAALSICVYV